MIARLIKRSVLVLFLTLAFWFLYPVLRVCFFIITDPIPEDRQFTLSELAINDASGLNKTNHGGVVRLNKDFNQTINILKNSLARSKAENKKIIPIGARHSMGKQSIMQNAIHIDLSALNGMKMENGLLRVQAGARWKSVLKYLAPLGLSVEIMQSNSDFSIGGTLSVNAHGWQPDRPPVASAVQKITLFTANGKIISCSREENSELFKHTIGGYGLFGIILEAWIKPVPNEILRSSHRVYHYKDFPKEWNKMKEKPIRLAFGRLSVAQETFFDQVLLTNYVTTGQISTRPGEYDISFKNSIARAVFRASLNSNRGKSFRQWIENLLGGEAGGVHARANLMLEPVRVFTNNNDKKTDILVEVFIPQEKFTSFIHEAKKILQYNSDTLLNVTVREIKKDTDSALPYARNDMFGLVMLFTIDRNKKAEGSLKKQIRALFNLAIKQGGTFYLPYRNYATPLHFRNGYPSLQGFLIAKKKWDPMETFYSGFYDYLLKSYKAVITP
jgi:hypothetical protein